MIAAATGAAFYRDLAARLAVRMLEDEPLAPRTTLRVGGPAAFLFEPHTAPQAAALWAALAGGPLPRRALGEGSNLVVADAGVRAAVVATAALRTEPRALDDGTIEAAAGQPVPGLARWAQRAGLAGLEFAEGIPASLGGAVRMNAGANGRAFADVTRAALVAGDAGDVVLRALDASDFGYRDSFARRERLLVLGARLALVPGDAEAIRATMDRFKDKRRATQPLQDRSAGCAFANYEDASVGALVEQLGLKGKRVGGAEVSPVHGNFIVNRGDARASDVLALLDTVRAALERATGKPPRLEVELWADEG